mgnify:CR=1 FL=1
MQRLQIILHFPILAGNNQGQLINFEIIFLDSIIDKLGLAALEEQVKEMLQALAQEETYGIVLRAKGMLPAVDGNWIYFDYVPGEWEVRQGSPVVTGKICVIGSALSMMIMAAAAVFSMIVMMFMIAVVMFPMGMVMIMAAITMFW